MPETITPESLDAALGQVLAAPPFVGSDEPSWAERWLQKLADWWSSLGLGLPGPAHRPWLTVVAAIAMFAVATWVVWRVVRALRRPRPSRQAIGAPAAPAPRRTAAEQLAAARQALSEGDTRAAIERLWQSVAEFSSPGTRSGLTPRKTLRVVQGSIAPDVAARFAEVLGAHERACYAGQPPSEGEVGQLIAALSPLLDAASASRAGVSRSAGP